MSRLPARQFVELCRAATEHSSRKAQAMRAWHPAAQSALLKHLSDSLDELPHPSREIELWQVRKGAAILPSWDSEGGRFMLVLTLLASIRSWR